MNKEEYKRARKELGLSVDDWVTALDSSVDTHKSLCSGRRSVQPRVKARIELLKIEREK